MLGIIIVAACLGQVEELPLVEETYDAIAVTAESDWQPKAYFIRDGKVIAERTCDDEWTFAFDDGGPIVVFNDYGVCFRRVRCGAVVWGVMRAKEDDGAWWNAGRVMTDLKQPGK